MRLALCALTYSRTRKAEFVTSVGYLWKTRVYRFHNSRKRVELALLPGTAQAMKRLGRVSIRDTSRISTAENLQLGNSPTWLTLHAARITLGLAASVIGVVTVSRWLAGETVADSCVFLPTCTS
jgi:hypothetical protein